MEGCAALDFQNASCFLGSWSRWLALRAASQKSGAFLHTRHLKAFHPKAILPFAPSSRAGGGRNTKKKQLIKVRNGCTLSSRSLITTYYCLLDKFWEGDTTTTRANQKTNIPKSTGFDENLDGLEMRAKKVGRAAAGWDSRESSLVGKVLPRERTTALHPFGLPPAFHSHRFPRFAPR